MTKEKSATETMRTLKGDQEQRAGRKGREEKAVNSGEVEGWGRVTPVFILC